MEIKIGNYIIGMLEGLNELILIKGLDKYMEHNKCSKMLAAIIIVINFYFM